MRKYLLLLCIGFFLSSYNSLFALDDGYLINSTLKLKTYKQNEVTKEFVFTHYGSAVYLGNNRIVTNAHVILDADGEKPTGTYEACYATPTKTKPLCFSAAKLIAYDEVNDLAVLEISNAPSTLKSIKINTKPLTIGTKVIVYGYPSIGGNTITRTEGKIGGTTEISYKFDGTIDHGNSGGSAFSESGELIGIPYAVSSDNGVIGYIIPSSTLTSFLSGKTTNYTKYVSSQNSLFSAFLSQLQKIERYNIADIKNKQFQLKGLNTLGFSYLGGTVSNDGNTLDLRYADKSQRNIIMIQCSGNAYSGPAFTDSIASVIKSANREDTFVVQTGGLIDAAKSVYYVSFTAKKANNGSKGKIGYFISNKNDCVVSVISTDGEGKDKVLYDKIYNLMKNVKFFPLPVKNTTNYVSSYFSTNLLPKNVDISYGTLLASLNIIPTISFHFPDTGAVTSEFSLLEFENLDEYMTYADNSAFTSKNYSFETFYTRYKTDAYSNVTHFTLETKSKDKFIFSTSDYSDYSTTPPVRNVVVKVLYPFQTADGKYYALRFSFDIYSNNTDYIQQIRTFFENVDFVGTNPFGK